jgi:hypothetical protein
MKKTVLWLVWVLGVCLTLTAACSPYEMSDPTEAHVTMLKDSSAQGNNQADPSVPTPEAPARRTSPVQP